jgi:uncharacterized protein
VSTHGGTLAHLHRWPVKSFAGEALGSGLLGERGLAGDRAHAVVEDGRLLSARNASRLLRWAASYPDAPDDRCDPAAPPEPSVAGPDGRVRAFSDPGLAAAIAADVGHEVELRRDVAGQHDQPGTLLVTTEASRRAAEAALGRELDLHRFRTNLHLDLDAPAFAEEGWLGAHVAVGEQVELVLLHPCPRCVIPTRDPDASVERWPELLRWLTAEHDGLFGINARVERPGRVAVGDRARVDAP